MTTRALRDRRLEARAGLALMLASARYWTTVAPIVRRELRRWELQAQAINDPELRALALAKLHGEGFHAEAAAMLATLAPRAHRPRVIEAIVALELLFDYLDGLTERLSPDPLGEGHRLFAALLNAVVPAGIAGDGRDYLEALSRTVSTALAQLPAVTAITDVARRAAERSAQAQTRMHAVPQLGQAQLEEWARVESDSTELEWRELTAGAASSVLVLHALIAAAAHPGTTPEEAAEIASTYLSMCVVLTLLDGLVDYEHDSRRDGPRVAGYVGLYDDPAELPGVLGQAARRAATKAAALPGGTHHVMIFVGVVAYYASAPGGQNGLAEPVVARLRQELAPLIFPTLAIMRAWRSARQRTRSFGAKGEGES